MNPVRDKINSIKYTARDFRGDVIAGSFNGTIFGLVYSFYFLPHDQLDTKLFARYRSSKLLYCVMHSVKMAAGFAIMRSTYNALRKQEVEPKYEIGGLLVSFGIICLFMWTSESLYDSSITTWSKNGLKAIILLRSWGTSSPNFSVNRYRMTAPSPFPPFLAYSKGLIAARRDGWQ